MSSYHQKLMVQKSQTTTQHAWLHPAKKWEDLPYQLVSKRRIFFSINMMFGSPYGFLPLAPSFNATFSSSFSMSQMAIRIPMEQDLPCGRQRNDVFKGSETLSNNWHTNSAPRSHSLPKQGWVTPGALGPVLWWNLEMGHIPIPSMYGIFRYICHTNQPNVGKYTIHGCYWIGEEYTQKWPGEYESPDWVCDFINPCFPVHSCMCNYTTGLGRCLSSWILNSGIHRIISVR